MPPNAPILHQLDKTPITYNKSIGRLAAQKSVPLYNGVLIGTGSMQIAQSMTIAHFVNDNRATPTPELANTEILAVIIPHISHYRHYRR